VLKPIVADDQIDVRMLAEKMSTRQDPPAPNDHRDLRTAA
jgi:hypothetical protein